MKRFLFGSSFKEIVIILFLFFFTFSIRFYKLSETSLYPDEITWMVRAKETALAIRTLDFKFFDSAWWNIKDDTEAIALPLAISTGFPLIYLARDQSVLSANLFQDYMVARTTVIILTSFFIVFFYFSVKKITNQKVAFLSSLLLTLDPLFLANSKLVMNDIFLSAFIFLALSSFLLIKNNRFSIIFASLMTALAFLTKPIGLIVLPIFLINKNYSKFLFTLLFTFVFITVIWPTAWTSPVISIFEYILRQKDLVGSGINNYFLGTITNNPSFLYYPFQLIARIPPMIVIFFVLSTTVFWSQIKNKNLINLILFVLLYFFILTISPKKLGIRYLLPIIPVIYIFASKILMMLKPVLIGVVIVYSFINFIYLFPNHSLYYNQLIGGMKNASKFDLIGLCHGSKESVDYILKCYPHVKSIGAIGCGNSIVPYYYPNKFNTNWKDQDIFYVENYYLQLNKDEELTKFVKSNDPNHIIIINGLKLSNIYVKDTINSSCQ